MSMVSTVATASQIPKKCARKRAATSTFDCSPTDIDIPEMALIDAGLEMQKELGHGNQSSVHLALRTTTGAGAFCCVKRFTKAGSTESSLEFMKDEYKVMQEVGRHPRLTQAYRMFQDASFVYIELALYHGGDFSDLKQNALRSGLCCDEMWWKTIFHQAMQGLAHLHQHRYTHCDVKEPNLMLKTTEYQEPEVVLIDFGVVQAAGAKRTAVFGTPGYIAPEVWDEKIWKPEGDAFSLGVVILQMLTDRVPNSDHPRCGIFTENTKNFKDVKCATQTREPDVSSLMEGFSTRLRQLVKSLLEKNPENRPTVLEALVLLESDIEHE
jgi:serine/threonine protein kinase